jgi:cytochrome c
LNLPAAVAQSSITTGGDIGSGHKLAERLCSNCHAVSSKTSSQSMPARSFEVLANQPGQSEIRLAGAIIIPHPAMPSVALTRGEIRDIVAYIMSLKASSAPAK